MKSFLDKVGKTASAAASKAGNKAGELLEIGKIKSKIASQKQDINTAKRNIGDYCYGLFQEEKLDDENIKELCEKIASCEAAIAELEQQIDDVKAANDIDDDPETCEQ